MALPDWIRTHLPATELEPSVYVGRTVRPVRRLREAVGGVAAEYRGHREFTRDIRAQVASGDQEAACVFRTGTLAAAFTRRGCDARGEEVARYVRLVLDADGHAGRVGWLHRP